MYTSDSVDDVIRILDRAIEHLRSQSNARLFIGLPAFIRFIEREPRLSSVVAELKSEADARLAEYSAEKDNIHQQLLPIWALLRPILLLARSRESRAKNRELEASDDFGVFEKNLASSLPRESHAFLHVSEPDYDPRSAFGRGSQMQEWLWSAMRIFGAMQDEGVPDTRAIESRLSEIQKEATFAFRRFWIDAKTLAGHAYRRLEYAAQWMNPPPPHQGSGDPWERHGHEFLSRDWIDAIYYPLSESTKDLDLRAAAIRIDLDTLHLQMRSSIMLGRSNISLLRRFAARCERFDARRLHSAARRAPRTAESVLRTELARFMFDCGLNPITDPAISVLRPDLLDVQLGSPIYVEAKQYHASRAKDQIVNGFRQVLDTRGRLQNSFRNLSDAFLVIFRVDGPRVEFPEMVQLETGRVFMTLADIGPANTSGSRQRNRPISVTLSDLIGAR